MRGHVLKKLIVMCVCDFNQENIGRGWQGMKNVPVLTGS